jgi:hypothetical protein
MYVPTLYFGSTQNAKQLSRTLVNLSRGCFRLLLHFYWGGGGRKKEQICINNVMSTYVNKITQKQ